MHNWNDNRVFFKTFNSMRKLHEKSIYFTCDLDAKDISSDIVAFRLIGSKSRLIRVFINAPYILFKAFRLKPKIIHLHDPELFIWSIFFLNFFKGTKVVYDMHELFHKQIYMKSWIPSWIRKTISKGSFYFEKKYMNKCSVVYAEKSYSKYFPDSSGIDVLNYPIVENFLVKNTKNAVNKNRDEVVIGYIGSITKKRGINKLIQVVNNLQDKCKIKIELVGNVTKEISSTDEFKNLISMRKLVCHGFVQSSKAASIMKSWDLGYCVLERHDNYIESVPTKIFEYALMQIPTLLSDFNLYKKISLSYGLGICADPDSVEDIGKKMLVLIKDRKKFKSKIQLSKVLEDFNWATEEKKLFKLYSDLGVEK